jgi:hypothetical protein
MIQEGFHFKLQKEVILYALFYHVHLSPSHVKSLISSAFFGIRSI